MRNTFHHIAVVFVAATYLVAATTAISVLTAHADVAPTQRMVDKNNDQGRVLHSALLAHAAKLPLSKQVSLTPCPLLATSTDLRMLVFMHRYVVTSSTLPSSVDLSPVSSRAPPLHI
jgi:hypothetical protein